MSKSAGAGHLDDARPPARRNRTARRLEANHPKRWCQRDEPRSSVCGEPPPCGNLDEGETSVRAFWLDRERYPSTPEQFTQRRRSNIRALVIVAAILIIGFAWTKGTFDNFLWRVHLNYQDCAQNGFGATFCGDDLNRYQQLINSNG